MNIRAGLLFATALLIVSPDRSVRADEVPEGYFTSNMEVVAYLETDPPPFKMSIQEVDGRWYLYAGLLMQKEGWEIIDVTDPANPELVKVIDGPENAMTFNMEIDDGLMVTALQKRRPGPPYFGDANKATDVGFYVWDVRDPLNPKRLSHYDAGDMHRLGYFGGPYVHAPVWLDGYKGFIYQIIDWQKNVEVGRWWLPGQKEGETPEIERFYGLHGAPYVVGDIAYLPYASAGLVIVDISDVSKPKFLSQLDFSPPFNDGITVHSVLPLPSRDLAIVSSEAEHDDADCDHALNFVAMVNVEDPTHPRLVSTFPIPEAPPEAPYQDFCEKTGRFGPHNLHQHLHNESVDSNENRAYVAYFNAGLRVYDTTNARYPKEIAYFIPPDPTRLWGQRGPDTVGSSTDDVLVDKRGFIYVTHTNQGLWILRLTDDQ